MVPTIRALEKLLMAKNNLATKEAGEALGQALAENSVLKELDVSDNFVHPSDGPDGPGFAKGIADGVWNNGVLTSLDISNQLFFKLFFLINVVILIGLVRVI